MWDREIAIPRKYVYMICMIPGTVCNTELWYAERHVPLWNTEITKPNDRYVSEYYYSAVLKYVMILSLGYCGIMGSGIVELPPFILVASICRINCGIITELRCNTTGIYHIVRYAPGILLYIYFVCA